MKKPAFDLDSLAFQVAAKRQSMTKGENEDSMSEQRNHDKLDAQMEIIENQADLSDGLLDSESSDSNNHIYVRPNQLDWKTGVARLISQEE
jgi:hypothetical protein